MNKKHTNRNLLVLFKQEMAHPKEIEMELEQLHELLYNLESIDNYTSAHEIIDLNRYKVYNNSFEIKKFIRLRKEQPFIFLNNKN